MPVRPLLIDATLRERGGDLSVAHRVLIAKILDDLQVDVVDLGAPSSVADAEALAESARALRHATPVVTVPPTEDLAPGVELAANAMASAGVTRFMMMVSLGERPDPAAVTRAVALARTRAHDVGVTFGEAFPADDKAWTLVLDGIRAATAAGARTILLQDGSGMALPYVLEGKVSEVKKLLAGQNVSLAVQCRNTLGLAVAGTLATVRGGADAIVATMTGVGEGAGCAALEEVATVMRVQGEVLGVETALQHDRLARAAHTVAKLLHEMLPSHKPVVGANAFAPVAGAAPLPFTAASVGMHERNFRLTSRSGRHMLKACLEKLGVNLKEIDLNDFYARFLKLADKKGLVTESDLEALLFFGHLEEEAPTYKLDCFNVMCGSDGMIPTASVRIRVGKRTRTESSTGNGPVDAIYNCLTRLTGIRCRLTSYAIGANGVGMDALGQVDVTVEWEGGLYHGMGLSTDILEASALAFLQAMNNIEQAKRLASEKSGRGGKKGRRKKTEAAEENTEDAGN